MLRPLLLALALASLAPAVAARENVLVLIADDLGTDQVGVYAEGAAPPPTPHLDALAADGVLFRNAWANPTCSPTRACIQTGRHGVRTGVGSPGPGSRLPLAETTIAEALDAASADVEHAWIGKWHVGGPQASPADPNLQGWSHFAGLLGGAVDDYFAWTRTVDGVSSLSTIYATTQIVDDALAWIGSTSGPWVCVVAFNAPHTPFHAPPAHLHTQALPGGDPAANPLPHYRAAVEAMDAEIGRLLASLGPALDDTNVVFLGDNGSPKQVSLAPFVPPHAKGSAYEGGVGVPLIVAGPAVVSPGREVEALVSAVDLFETVGQLVGAPLDLPVVKLDAVGLGPYLSDPSAAPLRETVYTESFSGTSDDNGFAAARDDRYKLIRRYDANGVATEELYDLQADPFETADLLPALSPAEQAAYDALDAAIHAIRDDAGGFAPVGAGGCFGASGVPTIAGIGAPAVGASYGVSLTGAAPSTLALLAVGVSDAFDARLGVPLPFDLATAGAGPGCVLYTSLEWLVPLPTSPVGAATTAIPVPDLPVLVGGEAFHSWLVSDPAAPWNPSGIAVTAGLRVTLGA